MALRLFFDSFSQPCRAVMLLLEANKIPYQKVLVNIAKGNAQHFAVVTVGMMMLTAVQEVGCWNQHTCTTWMEFLYIKCIAVFCTHTYTCRRPAKQWRAGTNQPNQVSAHNGWQWIWPLWKVSLMLQDQLSSRYQLQAVYDPEHSLVFTFVCQFAPTGVHELKIVLQSLSVHSNIHFQMIGHSA